MGLPRVYSRLLLVSALAAALAAASAVTVSCSDSRSLDVVPGADTKPLLIPRDGDHGHGHGGHHAAPVIELNETEVIMHHAPTAPSYYWIDVMEPHGDEKRHSGLMALHALFMSLAFFGALPIGIALRSVKHAWHGVTVLLLYGLVVLGLSTSALYRKSTPNMYEGSKHGSQGYLFLACAMALSALDIVSLVWRLVSYIRSIRRGEDRFAFKSLWNYVVLDRDHHVSAASPEYTSLVEDGEEFELEEAVPKAREFDEEDLEPEPSQVGRPPDGSLHASGHVYPWQGKDKRAVLRFVGRAALATAERSLVFAGLVQVVTGIVIYTGGCRGNYINGCLAHLIKGGIFWCYGLVTFARFLGSFSELGWAWNRAPRHHGTYLSAEFVESSVIFLYGSTNTWMERFGAHPGDPYTTKQMQHISIAVMFWFAGLVGMGIESKRIRRWLAAGATTALLPADRSPEAVVEPPSYVASFNPFPALCIGITGAAMSAHFQTYLFQVQIHMVWGYLLAGFAVMRCLTYFFLWLGPPRSILPSRPPTEALASFLLACGGLEFMFSTEELTIAAMRQGRDDVMMFLNVGVAITCLAFCWTLFIVAFKGWLKSRTRGALKSHRSA